MRRLALTISLATIAAIPFVGPKPKTTLLFTLKNHETRDPAVSRDGRRVYYLQDSTDLYMYDRATRQSTHALGSMIGAGGNVALSRAGDRLAFSRANDDGSSKQLWTVSLDPATGLPNGVPRRVSILKAGVPAFSPDGRSIAFATQTSRTTANIAVVPVNGGPERIVAETQGDVWPLHWLNADTLYFGLSSEGKPGQPTSGIYRVAVSGGTPQFVVRTADWGNAPGLTADGRFIVAYDTTWDSIFVATSSGRRVTAYALEAGEPTPDVWSGNGKAIGWHSRSIAAVRVMDLDGGKERVLSDTGEYIDPFWSPDGRQLAFYQRHPRVLIIANPDGSGRRQIRLDRPPVQLISIFWSPDGRWLFYRDNIAGGGIDLVEIATGKVRQIAHSSARLPLPQWRSDSKAILYGVTKDADQVDLPKKIEVHEVDLDGKDRLLHSFEARCNGGAYCGRIVNDSLLSTWAGAEFSVTNFRARGAPRVVYAFDGPHGVPTFSRNGRWMAIRQQSTTDQSWSIAVMHPDGSDRKSVSLGFRVMTGALNPWIRDDGAEFIIAARDCPANSEISCADRTPFYRVDVATGKTALIASTPRQPGLLTGPAISPNGKSFAYTAAVETRIEFYDFDFSDMLKAPDPRPSRK